MTNQIVSVDARAIAVRYGVVEVHNDHAYQIQRRLLPKMPSIWEAWLDACWRRLPDNEVRLYYNVPYVAMDSWFWPMHAPDQRLP